MVIGKKQMPSRTLPKPQTNLREVGIGGQDVSKPEFLHYNEAGQIGKGDVGLILIPDSQPVGSFKPFRRDALDPEQPHRLGFENSFRVLARQQERRLGEQARDRLVQHVIGCDLTPRSRSQPPFRYGLGVRGVFRIGEH